MAQARPKDRLRPGHFNAYLTSRIFLSGGTHRNGITLMAVFMKFTNVLFLFGVFILAISIVYLINIWFFSVEVIFYSAIVDGLIAAGISGVVWLVFRRRFALTNLEGVLLIVIWLLSGYAFAISGPTVLDRSLSFYILEKLQQRGGGIRADAMASVFIAEYMHEFRLIDVRLTEQTQSGTIAIVDGCVRLTPKGQRLATISRFLRTTFLAKQRLLAGVYTDALVDPFARSAKGPQGYEC